MKETHEITILIVDDHAVVRQGTRTFLESQSGMRVIGEAESGQQAIQIAKQNYPDVVLMDLVMPDMDGVQATRKLKQISPSTQVIIFSSYHKDEHIFPAIKAGALSYLLKDSRPGELAEAVRKAADGEAILHPRVAARLVQEVQGISPQSFNPFTELTEREMEVLCLIANGLTNREIAERLVVSERTAKSHVSNILSKLHLADRTQAAVYAWSEGIVHKDNQE